MFTFLGRIGGQKKNANEGKKNENGQKGEKSLLLAYAKTKNQITYLKVKANVGFRLKTENGQ